MRNMLDRLLIALVVLLSLAATSLMEAPASHSGPVCAAVGDDLAVSQSSSDGHEVRSYSDAFTSRLIGCINRGGGAAVGIGRIGHNRG